MNRQYRIQEGTNCRYRSQERAKEKAVQASVPEHWGHVPLETR